MKKQLELLFRLQSIDSNVQHSETLQRQFEKEVKKLQEELDSESQKSTAVKEEIDEQVKKHREAEAALKVFEDQKKKVQEKMMAIKTNKEFTAAQHEVASIDQAIGKQEEQIIMAMDAVESAKELTAGAEAAFQQAQQRFDDKKKQAATELSDYLADIENQKGERETLQQEIKPDMLRTYQQIFKARKGTAVVLADNEYCLGCNMKIPPQIYNEVVRADQLHTCPHCKRILYVDRRAVDAEQQAACDQSG